MSDVQPVVATEEITITGATFAQAKSLAEGFNGASLEKLDEEIVADVLEDAANFLADIAPAIKSGARLDLIKPMAPKEIQRFDVFNLTIATAEAGHRIPDDTDHTIAVAPGVTDKLSGIREAFALKSDAQAARVAVSLYTLVQQEKAYKGLNTALKLS